MGASVPEASAADLDNDGDLDIVYSRAGFLYVGTAIQIIENLGNKRSLKTTEYFL